MQAVSTPDAQRLRAQIQVLIVRIITSRASRERITPMLQNVYRDEKWPAIRKELGDLERLRRGGRGSC